MSKNALLIEDWLRRQIDTERNPRRRERLKKGLEHSALKLLENIWLPAVGNLEHLYPEWEVRDLLNRFRYIDLAYMPGGAKGCIEIHGYKSHARDVAAWRFKDLCLKQGMLALDDWLFFPIAYLSIEEEPELCKQLVLSFVGKFLSASPMANLDWAEAETVRYSRRVLRPFTMRELSAHMLISERHARRVIQSLLAKGILKVTNNKKRYRTYCLSNIPHQVFQNITAKTDA